MTIKMSDEEVDEFMKLFKSFMSRADVEIANYFRRESQIIYNKTYFHKCAKDVGVSVDYYLEEFL